MPAAMKWESNSLIFPKPKAAHFKSGWISGESHNKPTTTEEEEGGGGVW